MLVMKSKCMEKLVMCRCFSCTFISLFTIHENFKLSLGTFYSNAGGWSLWRLKPVESILWETVPLKRLNVFFIILNFIFTLFIEIQFFLTNALKKIFFSINTKKYVFTHWNREPALVVSEPASVEVKIKNGQKIIFEPVLESKAAILVVHQKFLYCRCLRCSLDFYQVHYDTRRHLVFDRNVQTKSHFSREFLKDLFSARI